MDTIDPTEYARFCGSVALATVLGITRQTAAHLLISVQRHRGLITAPDTQAEDMVLALSLVGIGAELFDTATGARMESAGECVARARQTSPHRAAPKSAAPEIIAAAPPESQAALWDYFCRRHSDRLRLRDFLMEPGTWLVLVDSSPEMHWLALRDHAVTSDTRDYLDGRVVQALHLTAAPITHPGDVALAMDVIADVLEIPEKANV